MKPLIIESNNKQAKYGAVTLGIVTAIMVGLAIAAIVSGADFGGPFTWVFCSIVFGWMYSSLIGITLLIFQLIFFQGPLITFSPDGVTDHFNNNTFLKWDEVKFVQIKKHSDSPIAVFKVVPKTRSLKFFLKKFMCRAPLEYPESYLSETSGTILRYVKDVGPSGIIKR